MNNHPKIRKPFDLTVKTLTPVSIGNGEILSPYTDFVMDARTDMLRVINKEVFAEKIVESGDSSLMTTYINGVYGAYSNNRSNFDLKNFLETHSSLSLAIEDYTERKVFFDGMDRSKKQEIKCIVKDNAQPYISGSTLKGGIKASILYDWLKYSETGKREFDSIMQQVLRVYKNSVREIKSIERVSSNAVRGRLNYNDKKEINDLKRRIKDNGGRELSKKIDRTIRNILEQKYPNSPRDFNALRPSDSDLIDAQKTVVQTTYRLHYNKGTVTIPVNLEAIPSDVSTNMKLNLQAAFSHPDLQYLNEDRPLEALFKRVNKFYKDNVSLELDLLYQYPGKNLARRDEKKTFHEYINFLENLEKQIGDALPNEAYLCVGFGKSFFYNSFGMLINDWDMDKNVPEEEALIFKKYCKLFFLGKDGQKDFPLTRTVTKDGKGMGWMKVTWAGKV